MKSVNRLIKVLQVISIIIITGSFVGIIYNFYQLLAGKTDIASNPIILVLMLILFGLGSLILSVVNYFKEGVKPLSMFEQSKKGEALRKKFKEEEEEFLKRFYKAKGESEPQLNHHEEVNAEPIEIDEFRGDPVYDNLDNIYVFAKEAFDAGTADKFQRDYIDADFIEVKRSTLIWPEDDLASLTVEELKELCRLNGISGYSGLRKAELIRLLENYNNAQSQ